MGRHYNISQSGWGDGAGPPRATTLAVPCRPALAVGPDLALPPIVLLLASVVAPFALSPLAHAEQPARDHFVTTEDYFSLDWASGFRFSPDGSQLVYQVTRWDSAMNGRNDDLWLMDLRTKETRRLTFHEAGDGGAQWSPDGQWVYFTTGRTQADAERPPWNGTRQVFRLSPSTGELQPVTHAPDGIAQYALSEDGASLYYSWSKDLPDDDPWAGLRSEHGDVHYGHGTGKRDELHRLDLNTWRDEVLVDDGRVIDSFRVSPDGRRVAMTTNPDEELVWNEGWSRVDVLDRETGEITALHDARWREEAPSPYGWLSGLGWSDDSEALVLQVDFDGFPGEQIVTEFGADGPGVSWQLTRQDEVFVGAPTWRPGSRDLCFQAQDHGRMRLHCVDDVREGGQGETQILTPGDAVVWDFEFSRDGGSVAYTMGTATSGVAVYRTKVRGKRLTTELLLDPNPQMAT
jgi:dipeptidyl aminopeptidase/acylaminoacyl peptidase